MSSPRSGPSGETARSSSRTKGWEAIGRAALAALVALGLAGQARGQEEAQAQPRGGDAALEALRGRLERQEQELEALRRELREGPVLADPGAEPGGAEPSDSVGPDDSPDRHPGQTPEPPTEGLARCAVWF